MIPILYESTETAFTSNGLGRLPDATECIVTEERNGAYELRMLYPVDGLHFSDIAINRFIFAVPADGKRKQPFQIYSIGKPLNGIVEVNAEHISYQLSYIPISPFTATSPADAFAGLKQYAAESCPFEFWTDKTSTGTFTVDEPVSIRSRLGGTSGSILDVYGTGEYEFDIYDVKFHLHRGSDNGVTLRYGKNITDIKQEENINNTYTGVMPFWKGTDADGEDVLVTLTEKVLHSSNAANFPYQRTIPLDMSSDFEDQPSESDLRTAAQNYMTANDIGKPAVSIDISFIALWQTEEYKDIANLERVNLCDTVTVEFPALDISAQAKVVKTEYDVLKDRYQSIELGDARTNFTQTVSRDISEVTTDAIKNLPSKSFLQQAVDRATNLITGGLGGYVVLKTNANGEPEEILIMDSDDIDQAVNVIRMNRNGIGFSTSGYEGPFTTAWTIDGHFTADFIDTGNLSASLITTDTMSADRIRGGVLLLGGGNNGNGTIQIYDASSNLIGTIDNTGVDFTGKFTANYRTASGLNYTSNIGNQTFTYFDYEDLLLRTTSGVGLHILTPKIWSSTRRFRRDIVGYKDVQYIDESDDYGSGFCVRNLYHNHVEKYFDGPSGRFMHAIRYADVYSHVITELTNTASGFFEDSLSAGCAKKNPCVLLMASDGIGFTDSLLQVTGTDSSQRKVGGIQMFSDYNPSSGVRFVINTENTLIEMGAYRFQIADGDIEYDGKTVAYESTSSKRYKHSIKAVEDDRLDPHRLLKLEVKQYVYNDDAKLQYKDMEGQTLSGFIAEDVDEVYPSAVIHNADGEVESWDERRIVPAMLSLIQEQNKELEDQKKKIQSLEDRIEKLEQYILSTNQPS